MPANMSTEGSSPTVATSLPTLPLPVEARILSYNVSSTKDAAELRLIGKSAGEATLGLLAAMASSSTAGHWISCPQIRCGGESFAERLVEVDHESEEEMLAVGDCMEAVDMTFFDAVGSIRIIGKAVGRDLEDIKAKADLTARSEDEIYQMLHDMFAELKDVESVERLWELSDEAEGLGLPDPIDCRGECDQAMLDEAIVFSSFLTFELSSVQKCIHRELAFGDEKRGYVLKTKEEGEARSDGEQRLKPLKPGKSYRAVSISPETVHVLLKLVLPDMDDMWELAYDHPTSSLRLDGLLKSFRNHELVEGVAISDGAVSAGLRTLLQDNVEALAHKQERSSDGVDYHPNSNGVVRDLVHPALYSYVGDVSHVMTSPADVLPCVFHCLEESDECPIRPTVEGRGRVEQKSGEDFWGRQYETSKYQWLPTYFDISVDGRCRIEDYINNLAPRDDPVHDALYNTLGSLFERALPYIESVYSYVQAVRRELRDADEEMGYDDSSVAPLKMKYVSLRGQKLQVITKIVDYELKPGQTYEGVWHVEGMSHEEIVLTCLYILDRDENVEGGAIEYKRAFLRNEADYIFSSVNQIRQPALEAVIERGLTPLGKVDTLKGRLIVFPNSHVHRVCKMINNDTEKSGKRRIVVFFLVNPQRRIVSTREVAPQQVHVGGKMSHEDALRYRLELMQERKFTKQDWNVRDIELCEH